MKAGYTGLHNEYITSGRLDDLQCAFASLQGFLQAEPTDSVAVHCVFDNEEVGSGSKQGAGGTFLYDILHRINAAFGRTEEDYMRAVASSFMVSADNAHAVHPNHPDKSDPTNRPYMNRGIVIKYNASQRYVTDAVSAAIFRSICRRQVYLIRLLPTASICPAVPPWDRLPRNRFPSMRWTSVCLSLPCIPLRDRWCKGHSLPYRGGAGPLFRIGAQYRRRKYILKFGGLGMRDRGTCRDYRVLRARIELPGAV